MAEIFNQYEIRTFKLDPAEIVQLCGLGDDWNVASADLVWLGANDGEVVTVTLKCLHPAAAHARA